MKKYRKARRVEGEEGKPDCVLSSAAGETVATDSRRQGGESEARNGARGRNATEGGNVQRCRRRCGQRRGGDGRRRLIACHDAGQRARGRSGGNPVGARLPRRCQCQARPDRRSLRSRLNSAETARKENKITATQLLPSQHRLWLFPRHLRLVQTAGRVLHSSRSSSHVFRESEGMNRADKHRFVMITIAAVAPSTAEYGNEHSSPCYPRISVTSSLVTSSDASATATDSDSLIHTQPAPTARFAGGHAKDFNIRPSSEMTPRK